MGLRICPSGVGINTISNFPETESQKTLLGLPTKVQKTEDDQPHLKIFNRTPGGIQARC